jgi:probable rRNA maturation factor
VLSFHYFEDFSPLKKNDIAGEIVLCEEVLRQQAIEYGLGEEKEFYKLVIHSVLHILGFDHETDEEYEEMKKLEEEVWGVIFPSNDPIS